MYDAYHLIRYNNKKSHEQNAIGRNLKHHCKQAHAEVTAKDCIQQKSSATVNCKNVEDDSREQPMSHLDHVNPLQKVTSSGDCAAPTLIPIVLGTDAFCMPRNLCLGDGRGHGHKNSDLFTVSEDEDKFRT